ncbi:VWA domain-containing protein [Herbidospora galbida]|uniref:VWA domain-containing protein n=1 Tax=Herbidospora galbida TaxID=2575442 RepID=A0A4U3M9J0_9ACTN|nr:VWA domain-containing protein [Herbidospora galbida]TKK85250.1 VWA domain-containing protein [Herbidospora galbida]
MTTQSAEAPRAQALPTYFVLDVSGSMRPYEKLLNQTLAQIINTLYTSPRISEFVHLSIFTFANRPRLVLKMTEITKLAQMPVVECRGSTYFTPLFEALRDRIEFDLAQLVSDGIRPLRPLIFLLTDGAPADQPPDRWIEAFDALTSRAWRPHPHVITYGFGEAPERLVKRMATVQAFIAEPGMVTDAQAITAALDNMLNSLVATAKARTLQVPDQVAGFRTLSSDLYES